ncbi:tautomerase family protein [Candidatus Poribacteria bacterium]|nr:tautomerase family protein [Candidatus Poribacteria bacterium]
MPHVNIKLYPGRTEEQKQLLTQRVIEAIDESFGVASKYVTVAFEEITPEEWHDVVVKPELEDKKELLYKLPEYL